MPASDAETSRSFGQRQGGAGHLVSPTPPSVNKGVQVERTGPQEAEETDVKMPRLAYLATSASAMPRSRLRSSFAAASAWHRFLNSHAGQWSFSTSRGG